MKLKSVGMFPNYDILYLIKSMTEDKRSVISDVPLLDTSNDTLTDNQRYDIYLTIKNAFEEYSVEYIYDIGEKARD